MALPCCSGAVCQNPTTSSSLQPRAPTLPHFRAPLARPRLSQLAQHAQVDSVDQRQDLKREHSPAREADHPGEAEGAQAKIRRLEMENQLLKAEVLRLRAAQGSTGSAAAQVGGGPLRCEEARSGCGEGHVGTDLGAQSWLNGSIRGCETMYTLGLRLWPWSERGS